MKTRALIALTLGLALVVGIAFYAVDRAKAVSDEITITISGVPITLAEDTLVRIISIFAGFQAPSDLAVGGSTGFDELETKANTTNETQFAKVKLTVGSGADQANWRNLTGETVYIPNAIVNTDGTASSTFRVHLVASSTASFPDSHDVHNIDAVATSTLFYGHVFATSTQATSSSVHTLNTAETGGPLRVENGDYVILYLQTVQCTAQHASDQNCDVATSTNRGFNLTSFFDYIR